MCFKEYPVFQTIEEAKIFCQQNSRKENRQLLFSYIRQQEPMFTESQRWGAPSVLYLQYILNGLYDLMTHIPNMVDCHFWKNMEWHTS